jgi:hypothetical protein
VLASDQLQDQPEPLPLQPTEDWAVVSRRVVDRPGLSEEMLAEQLDATTSDGSTMIDHALTAPLSEPPNPQSSISNGVHRCRPSRGPRRGACLVIGDC